MSLRMWLGAKKHTEINVFLYVKDHGFIKIREIRFLSLRHKIPSNKPRNKIIKFK